MNAYSSMAKTILKATSRWEIARRRVLSFPHSIAEESKFEGSLISVMNEPINSILQNECTQSGLKKNI